VAEASVSVDEVGTTSRIVSVTSPSAGVTQAMLVRAPTTSSSMIAVTVGTGPWAPPASGAAATQVAPVQV
jgi:hypothetical protein